MRQDIADVTPLPVKMNDNNEAVLVPGNVEHDEFTDLIRASKDLPYIREILPTSTLNRFDPMP